MLGSLSRAVSALKATALENALHEMTAWDGKTHGSESWEKIERLVTEKACKTPNVMAPKGRLPLMTVLDTNFQSNVDGIPLHILDTMLEKYPDAARETDTSSVTDGRFTLYH